MNEHTDTSVASQAHVGFVGSAMAMAVAIWASVGGCSANQRIETLEHQVHELEQWRDANTVATEDESR